MESPGETHAVHMFLSVSGKTMREKTTSYRVGDIWETALGLTLNLKSDKKC